MFYNKVENSSAVFLDRDGTIIEDRGYLGDIKDVKFYSDIFEALCLLQKYFTLFIVTNQAGISKGLTTENEVNDVNNYVVKLLKEESVFIKELFYCPHAREDNCICRKPKPYFINKADELYNIDLNNSYMIGDHPSDVEFGINAGVKPIYLMTGHGEKHFHELTKRVDVYTNMLDAAEGIINNYITKNKK